MCYFEDVSLMSANYINDVLSVVLTLQAKGTVFRRQNMTSVDVRFWRLMTIPALMD